MKYQLAFLLAATATTVVTARGPNDTEYGFLHSYESAVESLQGANVPDVRRAELKGSLYSMLARSAKLQERIGGPDATRSPYDNAEEKRDWQEYIEGLMKNDEEAAQLLKEGKRLRRRMFFENGAKPVTVSTVKAPVIKPITQQPKPVSQSTIKVNVKPHSEGPSMLGSSKLSEPGSPPGTPKFNSKISTGSNTDSVVSFGKGGSNKFVQPEVKPQSPNKGLGNANGDQIDMSKSGIQIGDKFMTKQQIKEQADMNNLRKSGWEVDGKFMTKQQIANKNAADKAAMEHMNTSGREVNGKWMTKQQIADQAAKDVQNKKVELNKVPTKQAPGFNPSKKAIFDEERGMWVNI